MELQKLSINELNQLFLQIGERYSAYLLSPLAKQISDRDYLDVRNELERILMEYKRREEAKK
jgi:hypothetical protein